MARKNGNKLVTTHFPILIGTYRKILWKLIKFFIKRVWWKNNIILIIRSNFHRKNTKILSLFRISHYATASTSESVLIIGGYTSGSPSFSSTIAEYKNGSWKNVGNLAKARYSHGAITSGSVTMVVGGWSNNGTT